MMSDAARLSGFEQPIQLEEILKPALRERLQQALQTLLQQPVLIQKLPGEGQVCQAIDYEFEPIAYVCVARASPLLSAAAEMVQAVLFERIRYRLAANLHVETIQRDFDALQEKHASLQASEQRYRELAEQLEQRVVEQVQVIDARQRQLYQSERMRAVGQLAAGMAHEINNPIGFIGANLRVATEYVQEISAWFDDTKPNAAGTALDKKQRLLLEDFSALLAEAEAGATRIAVIVKDLRTFSHVDGSQTDRASVGTLMMSALNMLKPKCPADIVLETQLDMLPTLICQPAYLAQAFFNVLENAIDAMPVGGLLSVAVQSSDSEILVSIRDTGVGMSPEQITQACNPFFTTKDVGAGTGLGLTVVQEVVQQHRGRLELLSAAAGGTEVIFHLPLTGYSA
jgi:two-component system, NtrC family, sensor kinase